MYRTHLVACVFLVFCLGTSFDVAVAEDFKIDASLGVDTVGVFRGAKSTSLNPSVGASVFIERGDFFGGMFTTPSKIAGEIRPFVLGYAGYGSSIGELDWSVSGRYYAFPDSRVFVIDLDNDGIPENVGRKGFFEGAFNVGFPVGPLDFTGGAFYSPNGFGDTGGALYLSSSVKTEIGWDVTLRGYLNRSEYENDLYNTDYTDYSVGLYREVLGFDLFLRYSNTSGLPNAKNRAVVFGIEKTWTLASTEKSRERRYRKIRNDLVFDKALIRGGY